MEYITRLRSLATTLIQSIGVQPRRNQVKRKNKITRPDVIELKGMPTAVKVGYRDIRIDYIRPDFKSDEMTDCYGEYRAREGRILLQHDVCGQEMCNVMFHEILHAIVYGSGLNQANCPFKEEDAEELTVNQMTNYIMGVFKDNPWMLDFLKQNLDKSEESI